MFTEIYEFCAHAQICTQSEIPKRINRNGNEMLTAFLEYVSISGSTDYTHTHIVSGSFGGAGHQTKPTVLVIATNNKRKCKHYSNSDHTYHL